MAERQPQDGAGKRRNPLRGLFTWTPAWSNTRFVATCILAAAIAIGIGVAAGILAGHAAVYVFDMLGPLSSDMALLFFFMLWCFTFLIICIR